MKRISCYFIALTVFCAPTAHAESAKDILDAGGVKGGLVIHLECGDGRLTAALRASCACQA